MVRASAVAGLPEEIQPGDDLAALILAAGPAPTGGEIVVVAHKAISKAEGRVRALAAVRPTARAVELAGVTGQDARHVQVILDESTEVLRAAPAVLICRTRRGFVCANAGVDASNAPAAETLVLHPVDPDASARALRARLRELSGAAPAVLVTDSFGRAWRHGQCDVAIGCAGLHPLLDWRGRADARGRRLAATWIALADQVAGAADLARTKDSGEPVVVVDGLESHVTTADGPGRGGAGPPAGRGPLPLDLGQRLVARMAEVGVLDQARGAAGRDLEPDMGRALVDAPALGQLADDVEPPPADVRDAVVAEPPLEATALVDHLALDARRVGLDPELDLAGPVEDGVGDELAHRERDVGHGVRGDDVGEALGDRAAGERAGHWVTG